VIGVIGFCTYPQYRTQHTAAENGACFHLQVKNKNQEVLTDMNLKWLDSINGPYIAMTKVQKPKIFS
jgi:hypothetical protein